jgi:hypothetical protein
MNIVLWILQGLLALAFLMAGSIKTFMPISTLQKRMTWVSSVATPFVRFIGVAELLGAIGLILPAATGILPRLTVAAAVGLVIVMLSAAVFNALRREYSGVGINVVLLLLAALVVIGRLTIAPLA